MDIVPLSINFIDIYINAKSYYVLIYMKRFTLSHI